MRHNKIRWFHPFALIGRVGPRKSNYNYWRGPEDDVIEYGVRLQLTTECTWYTYDWGWGFTLRVLGFGFEYTQCGL